MTTQPASEWTGTYAQFVKDVEAYLKENNYEGEYEIRPYRGRFFYDGPGIVVPWSVARDLDRHMTIKIQVDHMGLDAIVYASMSHRRCQECEARLTAADLAEWDGEDLDKARCRECSS